MTSASALVRDSATLSTGAINKVLDRHAALTWRGFETPGRGDFAEARAKMTDRYHCEQFERAVAWLQEISPTKTYSPRIDSYLLKHAAERAAGEYISNGMLIAAALHLRFNVKQKGSTEFAYIALSLRGWPINRSQMMILPQIRTQD